MVRHREKVVFPSIFNFRFRCAAKIENSLRFPICESEAAAHPGFRCAELVRPFPRLLVSTCCCKLCQLLGMSSFCEIFASRIKRLAVGVRSPLFLVFLIYALTTFGINLLEVPTVRLFENALCTRYYIRQNNATEIIQGKIVESWCKIPSIQDNLGLLRGWRMSLDAIPGKLPNRMNFIIPSVE